jgi:predicted GNAT family N-acyltransferase
MRESIAGIALRQHHYWTVVPENQFVQTSEMYLEDDIPHIKWKEPN